MEGLIDRRLKQALNRRAPLISLVLIALREITRAPITIPIAFLVSSHANHPCRNHPPGGRGSRKIHSQRCSLSTAMK